MNPFFLSFSGRYVLASMVVLCLLLVTLVPGSLAAGPKSKAKISDGLVMNGDDNLLLYFRLLDGLTPQVEEGVNNGIPLTFTFLVELHHHTLRGLQSIASMSFDYQLRFDTLKEEYLFTSTRRPDQLIMVRSLAEASELMTWVHDLPLIPLSSLQPGHRYTVKVMAKFARKGLPPRFQNVLGFVSMWDFSTDWHYISFTMPGESS